MKFQAHCKACAWVGWQFSQYELAAQDGEAHRFDAERVEHVYLQHHFTEIRRSFDRGEIGA